jgi:hypothetical protein
MPGSALESAILTRQRVKAILQIGSARVGVACIMEGHGINLSYVRMVIALTVVV